MRRTSTTHPLVINEIPIVNGGTLGLTFCPGKRQPDAMTGAWERDLDTDLHAIFDWGAEAVVTLMEPRELQRLQVANIGDAVEALGIDWYLLPIADQGVPDSAFERAWSYAGCRLRARLGAGERVVLHCQGGLGRTGTIAARLLFEFGMPAEDAMATVRAARPGTIENRSQEHHVRNVARPVVPNSVATRILGCVLGGAVGDAFGYEVEFASLSAIRTRFGPDGIGQPVFHDDQLVVSDDTQMSLFTAEGLLRALHDGHQARIDPVLAEIRAAYLDWLSTQGSSRNGWQPKGRLARVPALRRRRAPGNNTWVLS